MANATQEYVNTRLYPVEQAMTNFTSKVAELSDTVEALKIQITTRDADLISAERRFEELAAKLDRMEKDRNSHYDGSDAGAEKGEAKVGGILRNQAFRNLETYGGDHRKYWKWRSRLRGILFGEGSGHC